MAKKFLQTESTAKHILSVEFVREYDDCPDLSYLGECTFCSAVAEVSVGGVTERVTSGGIGGVESDSEENYFAELRDDEFADLGGILREMGFSARAIKAAIKDAQ